MKRPLVANLALLLLAVSACSTAAPHTGTGGGQETGGTGATGTGGAGTGGAAGTGGGSGTGGVQSTGGAGGSSTGGSATGGTSVTGGSGPGGTVGTGGTATGGAAAGGQAGTDLKITSTDFGDFADAFLVTPCQGAGTGHDCPNLPAGMSNCPTATWMYSDNGKSVTTSDKTGNTYAESFSVSGGDPNKVYDVTVRVRGLVEGRLYTGGMAQGTPNPNNEGNNMLYVGGRVGSTHTDYNVFIMTIAPPAGGTAIPNAPTFYGFNATTTALEGNHYNYSVDEMFTFKVKPGFTVTLTNHDENCIAIKNCGKGGPYNFGNAQQCEANAWTVSGVTLPATFRGQSLASGGKQPFQTQFLNFKVMSITAE